MHLCTNPLTNSPVKHQPKHFHEQLEFILTFYQFAVVQIRVKSLYCQQLLLLGAQFPLKYKWERNFLQYYTLKGGVINTKITTLLWSVSLTTLHSRRGMEGHPVIWNSQCLSFYWPGLWKVSLWTSELWVLMSQSSPGESVITMFTDLWPLLCELWAGI